MTNLKFRCVMILILTVAIATQLAVQVRERFTAPDILKNEAARSANKLSVIVIDSQMNQQ